MAEWSARRTHDPVVPGSSPALFILGLEFKSWVACVAGAWK